VLQSISPVQFFIQGRSTTQQLLSFLNYIYEAISHGYQTDVVYLDFWKAFDMVNYLLNCGKWAYVETYGNGLKVI